MGAVVVVGVGVVSAAAGAWGGKTARAAAAATGAGGLTYDVTWRTEWNLKPHVSSSAVALSTQGLSTQSSIPAFSLSSTSRAIGSFAA